MMMMLLLLLYHLMLKLYHLRLLFEYLMKLLLTLYLKEQIVKVIRLDADYLTLLLQFQMATVLPASAAVPLRSCQTRKDTTIIWPTFSSGVI